MTSRILAATAVTALCLSSTGCMFRYEITPADFGATGAWTTDSPATVRAFRPISTSALPVTVERAPGDRLLVTDGEGRRTPATVWRMDVGADRLVTVRRRNKSDVVLVGVRTDAHGVTGTLAYDRRGDRTPVVVPWEDVSGIQLQRMHRGLTCGLGLPLLLLLATGLTTSQNSRY